MPRTITKEDILADAVRVMSLRGKLNRKDYLQYGTYGWEFEKVFEGFADLRLEALKAYKESIEKLRRQPDKFGNDLSKLPDPGSPRVKCERPDPTASKYKESSDFTETTGTVETVNPNVQTLDELIAYAKIDLNVWEIKRHTINKWETVMRQPATTVKDESGKTIVSEHEDGSKSVMWTRDNPNPMHETLWQVKAWLEKKQVTTAETRIERLLGQISELSKPVPLRRYTFKDTHLLEISLFDAHFGMLSNAPETGDGYNLDIARRRYNDALTTLLNRATTGYGVERILFPIGNDFLHIDNLEGVTPASKHILDKDGRPLDIADLAYAALSNAVNLCLNVAPVHLIWIPGNHDTLMSYMFIKCLKAQFMENKNVTVDNEKDSRKFEVYGRNLIGFTHGNEEKLNMLPLIMADAKPKVWATEPVTREWHVGHFHKKKEMQFLASDSFGSVTVKVIPSICGTDAWHYKKGYVNGKRVAESFLYHKENGLVATFQSNDARNIT